MSFLGKKSYGKINEKYQSPPSEKTSTPFELLLLPKNQNSANSPPFLLISKKYYSSLLFSSFLCSNYRSALKIPSNLLNKIFYQITLLQVLSADQCYGAKYYQYFYLIPYST